MTLNTSRQDAIEHRRRLVARLRIRGMTQREIVDALIAQKIVNFDTGEAYSLATVNSDIKALDAEWRAAAAADTEALKAAQLAELREVKRQGWADKDMAVVLRALQQEAKLLGLDEPTRYIVDWDKLTPEQEDALARGVPVEKVVSLSA